MSKTYDCILPKNMTFDITGKAAGYFPHTETVTTNKNKTISMTLEPQGDLDLTIVASANYDSHNISGAIYLNCDSSNNFSNKLMDFTFSDLSTINSVIPKEYSTFYILIDWASSYAGITETTGCSYSTISTTLISNQNKFAITREDTDNTAYVRIVTYKTSCLTGDTEVLMNDSIKQLKDIEVGDKVMCINTDTGKIDVDTVIFTDKDAPDEESTSEQYDVWTFDKNFSVKTAERHRLYNVEGGCFKYLDEWNIGEHTINISGDKLKLLKHEIVNTPIKHYKITTEKYHNYFANGMLTGSRLTKPINYDDIKIKECENE